MLADDDSAWLGGVSVAQSPDPEKPASYGRKGRLSMHHSGSGFGLACFPSVFSIQMWNKETSGVFNQRMEMLLSL